MSSEEKRPILDLGPFFVRKPLAVIPPIREDGAATAGPNGLSEGDMNSGASTYTGDTNSKLKTILPPVSYAEDGSPNARPGADHDR